MRLFKNFVWHCLQVHAAAEEGVQIGNGDDIPAGQIRWSVEWQVCCYMSSGGTLHGCQPGSSKVDEGLDKAAGRAACGFVSILCIASNTADMSKVGNAGMGCTTHAALPIGCAVHVCLSAHGRSTNVTRACRISWRWS